MTLSTLRPAARRDRVSRRWGTPHSIRLRSRSRKPNTSAGSELPTLWTGEVQRAALSPEVDPAALQELRNAAYDRLAMSREPGWLAAFVRRAWAIIDPDPLIWNWHYSLLCWELEKVAAGITRELVISVPPGTGKSILVSALFPAALWLREPGTKILALAHIPKNVTRDSRRHRDVINSAWYRGLVERIAREEGIGLVLQRDGGSAPWTLSDDQNEKINFENTARGSREIGTVGGGITGTRCTGLIVDDPYDAKEATDGTPTQVAERMAYVVDQYDSNWKNRVHARRGWRVTIMQGLGEGDLADTLVRRGVRRVILPMEYDPGQRILITPPGAEPREERLYHPRDPRKNFGDPLFPDLFTPAYLKEFKSTAAGMRIWGPQYQQVRSSLGGRLFPRAWFGIPAPPIGVQRYQGPPEKLAKGLHHLAISVDCTYKDTKSSDRVSIQCWGWSNDNTFRFLLDRKCDRMDIGATIGAITEMVAKWMAACPGKIRLILIETKANGQAVVDLFKGRLRNVIGYNPQTSKYGRAQITKYAMQSGGVWYPMPEYAPWIGEVVEQHVTFTGAEGGWDDDIDAESQLMIHLDDAEAEKPHAAREAVRGRLKMLRPPQE